jgi:hypothetical protein
VLRLLRALIVLAIAIAPAIAEAGRCTGGTPCYACTNCSRCKHCKGGGSCGACNGGNKKPSTADTMSKPAPLAPEPMCAAGRATAALPPSPQQPRERTFTTVDDGALNTPPLARPRAVMAAESDELPGISRQLKPARTTARTTARTAAAGGGSPADDEKGMRDWKNADGEVLASGRFLSQVSDTLWVKTRDGRRVKLSLDEISEADTDYLESRKFN